MQPQRFDRRTFATIAGCALVGAVSAVAAYMSTHGAQTEATLRPLVWTVFATPFLAFLGSMLAPRSRGWQAALVCFMIYFFSIFVAARLERLIQGAAGADAQHHQLYFGLTIVCELVAALGWALRAAQTAGTMTGNSAQRTPVEEQRDGAVAAR